MDDNTFMDDDTFSADDEFMCDRRSHQPWRCYGAFSLLEPFSLLLSNPTKLHANIIDHDQVVTLLTHQLQQDVLQKIVAVVYEEICSLEDIGSPHRYTIWPFCKTHIYVLCDMHSTDPLVDDPPRAALHWFLSHQLQ